MRANSPWSPDGTKLRCNDCREYKSPEEFDRDPRAGNTRGRRKYCKTCRRERRGRHLCICGEPRASGKALCDSCRVQRARERRRASRRHAKRSPAARRRALARKIVREAVKCGALQVGPCRDCGSTESVELHHVNGCDDVLQWLNVVPLCRPCHQDEHRQP